MDPRADTSRVASRVAGQPDDSQTDGAIDTDAADLLGELLSDVFHTRVPTRSQATLRAHRKLGITIAAAEWFANTGTLPEREDWQANDGWPEPGEVLELFGSWDAMLEASGLADTPLVGTISRLGPALAAVRQELADAEAQRRRGEQELIEARRRDQLLLEQSLRTAEEDLQSRLAARDAQVQAANDGRVSAEAAARIAQQELAAERERVDQLREVLHAAETETREAQARSLALAAHVTAEFVAAPAAFRAWTEFGDASFDARLAGVAGALLGGRLRAEIVDAEPGFRQLFDGQELVTVRRRQTSHAACVELVHVTSLAGRPGVQTVSLLLWHERERGGVLTEVRSLGGDPEIDDAQLSDLAIAQTQVGELLPDAGWALQTGPRTVGPADFERFARFLSDPHRRRPVLALTSPVDGEPADDPSKLASALCGAAHVVVLTRKAAGILTEQFGEALSVWNGAVRCYSPGFSGQSSGAEHPFLTRWTLRELDPAEVRRELIILATWPLALPAGLLSSAEAAGMAAGAVPCLREQASAPDAPGSAAPYSGRITILTRELEQAQRGLKSMEQIVAGLEHEPPGSVLEAAERAAAEAKHLRFAPSAFDSAAESPFRRPAQVYATLMLLDQLAGDFGQGELGERVADRAAVLGLDYRSAVSRTSRLAAADEHSFSYEGRTLALGPHLVIGGGGGPLRNLRVYMYRSDGKDDGLARGLIVGHIGVHLPAKSGKD